MTEKKLFYRDPSGLLHEIGSMSAAEREYRDKYGAGIPAEALVNVEVKILNNEVNDDAGNQNNS